jgi:Protein of unknwon function (DUF3310)
VAGVKSEQVDHPSHYGGDTIYEHIKVCEAWGLGYALGNATKYIARAGKKGDRLTDLRKARWYLDHEIQAEEARVANQSSGGYLPVQRPPVAKPNKIVPARPAPRVPEDPSYFPQSVAGIAPLPPDEFHATTIECERRIAEVCPPWSTRHDETGHGAWRYNSVTGPVARVVKCAVTNTDVGSGVQLRLTFLREKPVEDSPEVATSDEWFQIKGHFKATD